MGRGGKTGSRFLITSLLVLFTLNPNMLVFLWSVISDDERENLSIWDEDLVDLGGGGLPGAPLGGGGRAGTVFPSPGLVRESKAELDSHQNTIIIIIIVHYQMVPQAFPGVCR